MKARLAALERAVADMQQQLWLNIDLSLDTARVYKVLRTQQLSILQELSFLWNALREVGILSEVDEHCLRDDTFLALFRHPRLVESLMLASGARSAISLSAASQGLLESIRGVWMRTGMHLRDLLPEGDGPPAEKRDARSHGRPRSAGGGAATRPQGGSRRPRAIEALRRVSHDGEGAAGLQGGTSLAAAVGLPRLDGGADLVMMLSSAPCSEEVLGRVSSFLGAAALEVLCPVLCVFCRHLRRKSMPPSAKGAGMDSGRRAGSRRSATGEVHRLQVQSEDHRSACMDEEEGLGKCCGFFELLQDIWQYSTMAEPLICAMEAADICSFRSVSRAGRECMRLSSNPSSFSSGIFRSALLTDCLHHSLDTPGWSPMPALKAHGWPANMTVKMTALRRRADLNGMLGMLVAMQRGSDKCLVILNGGERVSVRRAKLLVKTEQAKQLLEREWESLLPEEGPDRGGLRPGAPPPAFASTAAHTALQSGAVFVCGGFAGTHASRSVHYFTPDDFSWHSLPPMSGPRNHACSAIVGGRLHVIGGIRQTEALSSMECFDFASSRWCTAPRMSHGRSFASMAVLDGDIYVAGGCTKDIASATCPALRSLECFSLELGAWTLLPSMVEPHALAAMTSIQGSLYICGGTSGRRVLGTMERFTPSLGVWNGIFSLPWKCIFAAHVVHRDHLYLCGGSGGTDCVKTAARFQHQTARWERMPPMNFARCGAVAVVTSAGDVCVCGGSERAQGAFLHTVAFVECFRFSRGVWESLEGMWARQSFPCAVTLGDHLYVLGGKDGQGAATAAAERFDLNVQTWQILPPLPEPLVHSSASALHPA